MMTIWFRGGTGRTIAAQMEGDWSGPPIVVIHGPGTPPLADEAVSLLGRWGFLAVSIEVRPAKPVASGAPRVPAPTPQGRVLVPTSADLCGLVDQLGGKAALITGGRAGPPVRATMRVLGSACTAVVVVAHAGSPTIAMGPMRQIHELKGSVSTPLLVLDRSRPVGDTVLPTILPFLQRVHGFPQAV